MNKLKKLWVLLALLAIVMLLCANSVYRLWVGAEIEVPVMLSVIMAAYVVINAWNGIYVQFLNGAGIIKLQLYSAIWGMILNIPLAIYLGKKLGIAGVVLSSVVLGGINMIWTFIQYHKVINNKAKGIWAQ